MGTNAICCLWTYVYYKFFLNNTNKINPQFRKMIIFGEKGNKIRVGYTGTSMASVILYFLRMFIILLCTCLYITEIFHNQKKCFKECLNQQASSVVCAGASSWSHKLVLLVPRVTHGAFLTPAWGPSGDPCESPHLWTSPGYINSSQSSVKYN